MGGDITAGGTWHQKTKIMVQQICLLELDRYRKGVQIRKLYEKYFVSKSYIEAGNNKI